MRVRRSLFSLLVALVGQSLALAPTLDAQGQGVITGRVTDQKTSTPIAEAQVFVVGTNVGARTDSEGRYTIRGVPNGAQQVRILRLGYQSTTKPVAVTSDAPATVDFALTGTVTILQEVVTTATGEQRRVELGNSVANINSEEVVKSAPVSTVSDLLNSRAAGVIVTTGGQTGSGSRVRIRGSSSLNLNNDPIYIIDGIRMASDNGSIAFGTGGVSPSRVGDINPEEIENIEIVKGPSAATLYGTDAANGVIVITTKRGRAGAARWNVWGESGAIADRNTYPTNYTIAGHLASDATRGYTECGLPAISTGTCVMDSLRTYNLFDDDDVSPLGLGNRHQYGASVAGGTEVVRYFISAEREGETGVLELPPFERRRLNQERVPIRDWTDRPNALDKNSFRVNLNAAITPKLDASVSTGFTNLDQRYTLESNATAGLGSQAFGGPGYKNNGTVSGTGTPLVGYRAWTPGYTWQEKTAQSLNRFIGSTNANWRPLTWLTTNATVGIDFTSRVDDNLLFRGEGPPLNSTYRDGFKGNARTSIQDISTNLAATGTWRARDWLGTTTTLGVQYVNSSFQQNSAEGDDLPPGTQTAGAAAIEGASESSSFSKTLGFFIEEQLAFSDRLFLTGALRSDQNSAFGTDFQSVIYPKASVSWILTEESWFPAADWLGSFRYRAAYGASGRQPEPNDAIRSFSATTVNLNAGNTAVDQPGVLYSTVGNTLLKPETTTEFETGFEAQMFTGRVSLDLTYYAKRTKDALISAVLPPSGGVATSVRRNLGAVRNRGFELLVNTAIINRPQLGFDVTLNGSTNANKLLSLGETPPQIGVTTRVVEGYPLFGFWGQKIRGWDDKNHDGILTYNADAALNEVFVDDSASFIGYNQPRHIVSLTSGLELFSRRLRLQTLFDYRGGHYWYNNTERIRCLSRQNCNGLMNPDASFEEQAMVVASRDHPTKSVAGYIQKGAFVRLREVSVRYDVPERFLTRVGGMRSLSLNVSARNIARWTDYRGVDPETDRTLSDNPDEFQTIGPPSFLIFRLNAGF
jgi:TonB-linked SusC/RagA family outer membrane protein